MTTQTKRTAIIPRKLASFEHRAEGDQPTLITGYGAVYYNPADPGSQYRIQEDLVERFRPGCFDAWLASDRDCLCAPYHDERRVLGRRSRFLRLSSDDRGLRYSLPYDASDPDHVALAAKLRRGDVSGSSVEFVPLAEEWSRDPETDLVVREVVRADVYHLGPVIGEAYPGATAEIRSDSADGWQIIQDRKAMFLAAEYGGADALRIELEALLLD